MTGLLEKAEEDLRRAARGADFLDEVRRYRRAPAVDSATPDWSAPVPLPDGLPPVAAFDFAMLPDTLEPWAADICERVQCAPDFVAVAIMAGLGSIIGRRLGIRPQARTDWKVDTESMGIGRR